MGLRIAPALVVGIDDDVNLYAYVGNDPLSGVDPTGTSCMGSRVGAGCEFVGGSLARIKLEAGSTVDGSLANPAAWMTNLRGSVNGYAENAVDYWIEQDAWYSPAMGTFAMSMTAEYDIQTVTSLALGSFASSNNVRNAAVAGWNRIRETARNVSMDGPSPGVWYANGRIIGLRWKQSQWGIRLDLHPMKGDPTNTPVLHLSVGPLGRGEAGHIPLFDPRWFRWLRSGEGS